LKRVPITSGEIVVTDIYHWDETNHQIYFRATKIGSPGELEIQKLFVKLSFQNKSFQVNVIFTLLLTLNLDSLELLHALVVRLSIQGTLNHQTLCI